MIISFEKELFNTGDEGVNLMLAEIIDSILEERCLIDFSDCWQTFYNDDGEYYFNEAAFTKDYLSIVSRNKLKDLIELLIAKDSYVTKTHHKYLSYCKIGFNEGYTTPLDCLKLLKERSIIILENATNDFKFIRAIVSKYVKHKNRRSIYQLIQKSIDNNWLIADQAGGNSQITARFINFSEGLYANIYKFKIFAMFDSDKENKFELKNEPKLIVEYFKQKIIKNVNEAIWEENDLILWHMLYKREIENYVPVSVVMDNVDLSQCTIDYKQLSMDAELVDFVKYDEILPKVNVKNIFPDLFLLDFSRTFLETRCEHHRVSVEEPNGTLVSVSEIEQILLKIAKII